jgi:hypothetical protein
LRVPVKPQLGQPKTRESPASIVALLIAAGDIPDRFMVTFVAGN